MGTYWRAIHSSPPSAVQFIKLSLMGPWVRALRCYNELKRQSSPVEGLVSLPWAHLWRSFLSRRSSCALFITVFIRNTTSLLPNLSCPLLVSDTMLWDIRSLWSWSFRTPSSIVSARNLSSHQMQFTRLPVSRFRYWLHLVLEKELAVLCWHS